MTRKQLALFSLVGAISSAVVVYTITPPRFVPMALRMGLDVSIFGVPEELAQGAAPEELPAMLEQDAGVEASDGGSAAEAEDAGHAASSRKEEPKRVFLAAASTAPPVASAPSNQIRFAITGPNGFGIQGSLPMPIIPPLPPVIPVLLPPIVPAQSAPPTP